MNKDEILAKRIIMFLGFICGLGLVGVSVWACIATEVKTGYVALAIVFLTGVIMLVIGVATAKHLRQVSHR